MSIPAIPNNFFAQQGNREVALQWDAASGATTYSIQKSTDNVNFSVLTTVAAANYLDTAVVVGTQYWYKVASVNADGTSPYTSSQWVIPAPNGELSLKELRLRSQQKADRVNSEFVTLPEWNFFIDQSLYELYDLLITSYEDYFEAPEVSFGVNGSDYQYPLPDGITTFTDNSGASIVAPPFYKLSGVDLAISNANNAWVTMDRYNLIDRNKFVYPNSASTIYGVFNLQYRIMDNKIRFIPTPSAGQIIRLLYIPRLRTLLQETDMTTIGYSGWLQYVIIRAAKYALDKEESDTTKLDAELLFLKKRIEETAVNRDKGRPDTVSDSARGNWNQGGPFNGFKGGW